MFFNKYFFPRWKATFANSHLSVSILRNPWWRWKFLNPLQTHGGEYFLRPAISSRKERKPLNSKAKELWLQTRTSQQKKNEGKRTLRVPIIENLMQKHEFKFNTPQELLQEYKYESITYKSTKNKRKCTKREKKRRNKKFTYRPQQPLKAVVQYPHKYLAV